MHEIVKDSPWTIGLAALGALTALLTVKDLNLTRAGIETTCFVEGCITTAPSYGSLELFVIALLLMPFLLIGQHFDQQREVE